MKEYIIRTDAELRVENGRLIAVHDGSEVHVDMFKELPPHGKLIDVNALDIHPSLGAMEFLNVRRVLFKYTPAFIEASKED